MERRTAWRKTARAPAPRVTPASVPAASLIVALIAGAPREALGLESPGSGTRAGLGPGAEASPSGPGRALVLLDDLPGADEGLARRAAAAARDAGYETSFTRAADLALDPAAVDLLILPAARALPAAALPAVVSFLGAGGDILALGLPAWRTPLWRVGGRWMGRADYEEALRSIPPERILLDFEGGPSTGSGLSGWLRHTNDPASKAARAVVGSEGSRSLHVAIESLTGWDTLEPPASSLGLGTVALGTVGLGTEGLGTVGLGTEALPEGHSLTCFRARGGPGTTGLIVEWAEADGMRWIAPVELGREWRSYVLPPDTFQPWHPPAGRGGAGDRLDLRKVVRFTIGLARSHLALGGGRHEYSFDDLGTARNPFGEDPFGEEPPLLSFRPPPIEGLCPDHAFFPIASTAGPVRLSTPPDLALAAAAAPEPPAEEEDLVGIHPRPGGAGFEKGRRRRWQPILEARSPGAGGHGDYRGAVGVLAIDAEPPFRGAIRCAFSPTDPAFYGSAAVQGLLRDVLARMRRACFLREGGAEHFTVFEGDEVRLGARVVNVGRRRAEGLSVRIRVGAAGGGVVRFEMEWPVRLAPGAEAVVEATFDPLDGRQDPPGPCPEGGLRVITELIDGGQTIDRLVHELHVWRPRTPPRFVEIRDGRFVLDGRPWKAHGVNYMPSSGIGLSDGRDFEGWLDRSAYDPEIVGRDLARIRGMGFNAVSVFIYHRSLGARNLLDFLRLCDLHGLRVNQSLRPGTPMAFRWEEMKAIVEGFRLADRDTVFAYDLAWEPSHYGEAHQRSYDPAWARWVIVRHGSLESAEEAWGVPIPGGRGAPRVPPMAQLVRDGPWRRLIADYRRFLDDLVGERYAEARRLLGTIDPRHPVSFRMQFAGDPTHDAEGLLPYDFPGLAGAVDIWEPEAYGRIGDWEAVRPGRFTADYARLCDPSKPIVWSEAGMSVWDSRRGAPSPELLDAAARFYRDFYRMLRESGAQGVFFWWYPGGYRVGEASDFGIIEPDGTDRPVTRVIREEGPRFLEAPPPPSPDRWISVDRDADARGLFGIYEAVREEYWRAIEEGKTPGLRWLRVPGGAVPE